MSLPQRRLFWPCRSSSPQRWLAHEIGQQPVLPCRRKSANMLEMPDFIGCLQFFAFRFKWANRPRISWKSVLYSTAPWRRPRSRLCPVFGVRVEIVRSPRGIDGPAGLSRKSSKITGAERFNLRWQTRLTCESPRSNMDTILRCRSLNCASTAEVIMPVAPSGSFSHSSSPFGLWKVMTK